MTTTEDTQAQDDQTADQEQQTQEDAANEVKQDDKTSEAGQVEESQEGDSDDDQAGSDDKERDDHSDEIQRLLAKSKKQNAENQSLRERAKVAELKVAKWEAAIKVGLPTNMVDRIHGDDAEALEKDAAALMEAISGVKPGGLPRDVMGGRAEPIDESPMPSLSELGESMFKH